MKRIILSLSHAREQFSYLDSVHAAIVAGLVRAGADVDLVCGARAAPWTFAVQGFARSGGLRKFRSITISTSSPEIGDILSKLDPRDVEVMSSNGDRISLSGARKMEIPDPVAIGTCEHAFAFISPFAVMLQKHEKEKTMFARDFSEVDLSAAFTRGLSQRLGRDVALDVSIDPLTRLTSNSPKIVRLRKQKDRIITVPAFSTTLTLRGSADDIRSAYFAGLGAKTRYGFGCLGTVR